MSLPPHPYAHTLSAALAPPRETVADRTDRLDRVPQTFLDSLFIAMQSEKGRKGFAADLRWCAGLCAATWREEALWNGLVHVRRGGKKRTHLMYAVARADVGRVRWLLARGAPLEFADEFGRTAVMSASWYGNVAVLKELIAAGASVNAARRDGYTALLWASSYGYVEVARALLAGGADVDTNLTRMTPLHWAAYNGHVGVISLLLGAGADAARLDAYGCTARRLLANNHPTRAWPAP